MFWREKQAASPSARSRLIRCRCFVRMGTDGYGDDQVGAPVLEKTVFCNFPRTVSALRAPNGQRAVTRRRAPPAAGGCREGAEPSLLLAPHFFEKRRGSGRGEKLFLSIKKSFSPLPGHPRFTGGRVCRRGRRGGGRRRGGGPARPRRRRAGRRGRENRARADSASGAVRGADRGSRRK